MWIWNTVHNMRLKLSLRCLNQVNALILLADQLVDLPCHFKTWFVLDKCDLSCKMHTNNFHKQMIGAKYFTLKIITLAKMFLFWCMRYSNSPLSKNNNNSHTHIPCLSKIFRRPYFNLGCFFSPKPNLKEASFCL